MNPKLAIKIMLISIGAVMLLHIGILLKLVPYEMAWGGRLKSDKEMYIFEGISILVNGFLLFVLLVKGNYLKAKIQLKAIHIILWVFLFLFGLNTIGNILATTTFEKCFSIITLAFCWLIWIVLKRGIEK